MDDYRGALTAYIQTRRGVGHTTLMKEGVKNYDKPFFVLGADIRHAKELMTGVDNKNAIPLGLHSMANNHKLDGVNHPMIIDAFTVQMVCEKYEHQIQELKFEHSKKVHDLRKEISLCNRLNSRLSKRIGDVRDELSFYKKQYEKMCIYTIGVNKKVKAKLLGMSLFNRIFRYNKALEK